MAKKSLIRGIVSDNLVDWAPVLAGQTKYDPANEPLVEIIREIRLACSYSSSSKAEDVFRTVQAEFHHITTGSVMKVTYMDGNAHHKERVRSHQYPADCFHPHEWHSFPFDKTIYDKP